MLVSSNFAQTTDTIITKLFQDSYYTIKSMRQPNGVYLDKLSISGKDTTIPGAISANGVGLISLCIADAMFWEVKVDSLANATLNTFINFKNSKRTTTPNGFYRRFFNVNTCLEYKTWGSEYSTIDNAIFAAGLIFCKNYFSGNKSIVNNANILLNAMDFTAAISLDSQNLYMVLDSNGTGSSITGAYNEYMIVAWLAKNVCQSNPGYNKSQAYWNTYYSNPKTSSIKHPVYWYYELLSDRSDSIFISNFIPQFTYYYCNYYKNNNDYMYYFNNARKADSLWWNMACYNISRSSYEWGVGAGDIPGCDRYYANAINNDNADSTINKNIYRIVSPHIIAGFIPVYPQGKNDLKYLFNNGTGAAVYSPKTSIKVLWRYSVKDKSKRCNYIQAVDFATMLYGLASLPEYLGPDFFNTYNEIKECIPVKVEIVKKNGPMDFSLKQNFPNPFNPSTTIEYRIPPSPFSEKGEQVGFVSLKVYDLLGREVAVLVDEQKPAGTYTQQWNANGIPSGVYFYRLQVYPDAVGAGTFNQTKKLILLR